MAIIHPCKALCTKKNRKRKILTQGREVFLYSRARSNHYWYIIYILGIIFLFRSHRLSGRLIKFINNLFMFGFTYSLTRPFASVDNFFSTTVYIGCPFTQYNNEENNTGGFRRCPVHTPRTRLH